MTTEQHTAAADVSIAYFITSYGESNQLLRLVTTLRSAAPDAPIVIHHDVFRSPPNPALQDIPNVHLLTSDHPIVWGDMTLEAARWRVFRWILTHLRVDWVVLLSEQDYPIAPLRDLPARLADADVDAVILGERIDQITDPQLHRECELRYLYRYVSLPPVRIRRSLPASWRRSLGRFRGLFYTAVTRSQRKLFIYTTPDALELPSRIGLRQGSTPFSEEFPCWYNDCWYALSRKALRRVVDFVDTHPDFVRYYQRTVIPLESATATIVFNDPELRVANQGMHAIRWSDPASGRPDVFGLPDLEFLRDSTAAFARKFGQGDTDILDELDRIVLSDSAPMPATPLS